MLGPIWTTNRLSARPTAGLSRMSDSLREQPMAIADQLWTPELSRQGTVDGRCKMPAMSFFTSTLLLAAALQVQNSTEAAVSMSSTRRC